VSPGDEAERGGGFLDLLSTPPEKRWPDAAVHHGVRIALLLGLSTFVTLLFPTADRADVARYEVGTVADATVQAEVPFAVPKSAEELRNDRAEAAAAVPPTFEYRPGAADSMEARLVRFFDRLEDEAQRGTEGVAAVLEEVGIAANDAQIELLADSANRATMRRAALGVAQDLIPRGVMDASHTEEIATDRITVRRPDGERSVAVDSVWVGREFLDRATSALGLTSPEMEALFRLVLIRFMEPSYVLDMVATEVDREAARRSVPTVRENVLAGQVIVRQGDPIGRTEVERLNAYQEQLRSLGITEETEATLVPTIGAGILHLMVLTIFGLLLYFFRRDVYGNFRWVLLIAGLTGAYFGSGAVISAQEWPVELLPVAFLTLSVAVLWDGRIALVLGMVVAVLTGFLSPFSELRTLALVLMGGAGAALAVRVIRRRAQTWIFVAVIAAAYATTILSFALIQGGEPSDTLVSLAWAGGNATVSAILAMGFVPVFEWFTGITTDQTLLEWADPNRPLLKRLSMEAPGTYAHTINVANLAEAAANGIGANGLLCRVGVYYHDIGKMLKPQYFVENQPAGRNPHDRLKPETSASIIREHVVEGIRLAREEGLPQILVDFIAEHHGTQRIGFFYERAQEENGETEEWEVDGERFRYPGPRPRSRETAIVMLADSVESATRALQEPTPERTRELVEKIVDGKIEADQLDEAPLTLGEIARIKEHFAKILTGMYHQRIDYPSTKHLTDSPGEGPAGEGPAGEGGVGAGGEGAHEGTPGEEEKGRSQEGVEGARGSAGGASGSAPTPPDPTPRPLPGSVVDGEGGP